MRARVEADPAVREEIGSWYVTWRSAGFILRSRQGSGNGFFLFSRIILPVEIVPDPGLETGRAVLKLDPFNRVEVLWGASRAELERFKRRVSGEVLAAVKTSPFGCSDCATEAGMIGVSWNGDICPGCREYYCRSPRCLRRLRVVVLRSGFPVCSFCGTRKDAPRRSLPSARR